MSLREIPLEERPRERLVQHGAETLSLVELIAIVLTTGTKGKTVLELSQEVVTYFKNPHDLLEASLMELMAIKGIGKTKAIQLKAALGIAQRFIQRPLKPQDQITAQETYELVKWIIAHQKQEVLMVVLKDVKGRLITCEKVSVGTLSEVLIHPREIFYPAVRHKAHSFILAHNHPSGDPSPSAADLEVTRHLLKSSRVMGIHLDDHVIVGSHSFVSLKEKGCLR